MSYILTLNEDLMSTIDKTIKDAIPDLKDSQLLNVGKVFHEAALLAKQKEMLPLFEKECLRGFIGRALYCHRIGPHKASLNYYKVFGTTMNNIGNLITFCLYIC